MEWVRIQDVLGRKFSRQKEIRELEYHASGHCVHIGRLSPGCLSCFVSRDSALHLNYTLGKKCNARCAYCTSDEADQAEIPEHRMKQDKLRVMVGALFLNTPYHAFSFTGGGEPLLCLDAIAAYMRFLKIVEKSMPRKPWYYLYTNGLLADRGTLERLTGMGFDEIRFHLGASGFSARVYDNLRDACAVFPVVTVETPAWPPHREELFEMLPIIQDLNVRHLNIGEVELTKHNLERIRQACPQGRIYQCHGVHLYDEGLVYDLMEEVVSKRYSYSVLDCSSLVKSIQRSPGRDVCFEEVEGLCEEYVPGS